MSWEAARCYGKKCAVLARSEIKDTALYFVVRSELLHKLHDLILWAYTVSVAQVYTDSRIQ